MNNSTPEWEKKFDEQYEPYPHTDDISSRWKYGAPSPISIKRFISSLLTSERTKIREMVEGMRMKKGWMPLGVSEDPYNAALKDVLLALTALQAGDNQTTK